jgi:hypothetical protein
MDASETSKLMTVLEVEYEDCSSKWKNLYDATCDSYASFTMEAGAQDINARTVSRTKLSAEQIMSKMKEETDGFLKSRTEYWGRVFSACGGPEENKKPGCNSKCKDCQERYK